MGRTRASRVPNGWRSLARRLVAVATVLVVLAAVAVGGRWAWQEGHLNEAICGGDCGPSSVTAPAGLLTGSPASSAVSPPVSVSPVDPDAVVAAVEVLLTDSVLGPHAGFAAAAPGAGSPVSVTLTGGDTPRNAVFTPASTTKLLTALTALATIEPQTRFSTTVVDAGDRIVLVGGGDPYLTRTRDQDTDRVERADLEGLAQQTADALLEAGRTSVALGFDAGLFTGPAVSPAWEDSYVPGNIVTPVSALWVDQGVVDGVRSRTPPQSAAEQFADLLGAAGVTVTGDVESAPAPTGAATIASVRSSTIEQIVETVVRTSDNEAAEVLLRHVGIATGRPGSFSGGTEAVVTTLQAAEIDTAGLELFDGSGLSRRNRISPTTLVGVVAEALSTTRGAAVVDDLPISGFSGTLSDRFDASARGLVRAKTGTLSGVHSLAGYALDAEGRPVIFAVMTDDADLTAPVAAQDTIDDIAAAIAACSCG